MKRVIIVHRWSGSANDDWQPWLKSELEKTDYEVLAPDMPDSDTPVIEKWVGCLARVVGTPDKDTLFVGHSIGCQAILRYLDAHLFGPLKTVGGAIFVAGWFNLENLENKEVKEIALPWIERPINFEKIRAVLPKSTLIISDNDPYGAIEENKQKFSEIGPKIVVLPGAGHITAEDGFTKLPLILSELQNLHMSTENKEERMPEVRISMANPEDTRGIAEVFYKTWLVTYPNKKVGITVDDIEDRFKNSFTEESLVKRAEQIANPKEGETLFLAKDGDKVVGVCVAMRHPDKNQLQAIYVLPEYQGKGVGRLLWIEAQKRFSADKDTIVQVAIYNTKAIDFYRKLGFAETGKQFQNEHFRMKSGVIIPETEMIIKAKNKN